MKVLLVEDAEGMRKIIGSMLHNMGYDDVVTAENGKDALEVIASAQVDLLLTNWNMPVMDGLQLVQRVRQRSEHTRLPVIMFTSRASRQDVVRALRAGVDGYVAKPFTPSQLREQIDAVFRRLAQRQIQRVEGALDRLRREDTHPLLLIAESVAVGPDLERPHNRDVLRMLSDTAGAVGRIAGRSDPPVMGLAVESDATRVGRLMRALGSRVKMLVLSTRLSGGGLTLARLASVNKRGDLSVFVVCERKEEVPEKARAGLERLGITLFERRQLDSDSLAQLTTEHVMAAAIKTRPAELPSPEEIRARLETDIRTTVTLPVMPQVYHDIATLADDPESALQKWVEAIAADPLSSAQVVRRARSPAYGFRGEVREADQAVILLGKNAVRQLVVSEAVRRAFEGVQEDAFDLEDFWFHSVSVAIVARLLSLPLDESQRTPEQQKEFAEYQLSDLALAALGRLGAQRQLALGAGHDPFVGGMMHDIGKVALVQSYPGLYPAVRAELVRQSWDVPMRYAEETIAGGADHTSVGGILADSWRLGDEMRAVVEGHHSPDGGQPVVALTALADLVAGGISPYPKDGTYPLVRLARQDEAGAPAPAPVDSSAERPSPKDPREALEAFLPPGLCAALGLSPERLVELVHVLAPAVRQRAEDLRRAL